MTLKLKAIEKKNKPDKDPANPAIINSKQSHFLKTIRYKILSIPAYLEKKGDKNVLRLVRTMNQRQAFLGLWRTTENFDITRTNWA